MHWGRDDTGATPPEANPQFVRQDMQQHSWDIVGDGELITKINAIIFELVLRSGRPFSWTSLQAHRNVHSTDHTDEGIDIALLAAVGPYEGGHLVAEETFSVDIRNKAI